PTCFLFPLSFPTRRSSDLCFRQEILSKKQKLLGIVISMRKHLPLVLILAAAVAGVARGAEPTRAGLEAGFSRTIQPFFDTYCSADRKSTRLNSSHQIISYA